MTVSTASRLSAIPVRRARWDRRLWGSVVVVAIGWSFAQAGADLTAIVNRRGWSQVTSFFSAMFHPDLSWSMLTLTVREAGVTLGYALVGTALALVIGTIGGVLLTERIWQPVHGSMRWGCCVFAL